MFKQQVIFAIDNNTDWHTVSKFMRHLDTCRVMGKLQGSVIQCVGYWQGVLEQSYMMDEQDYLDHVAPLGFAANQDCILVVPGDVKQFCHLQHRDGTIERLNVMRQVSAEESKTLDGWTYVPVTDRYFTCA